MKRVYRVEMVPFSGEKYIFEFETENFEQSLSEYLRTTNIRTYKVLDEGVTPKKQMLFG